MAGLEAARRRRASRLHPIRLIIITLFCMLLSGFAGAAAYFFPVVVAGVGQTGQTVVVPPGASSSAKPSATPTPPPAGAPFTVLLLGSDDDLKFDPNHVLTQSMILVRVDPASKHVTMESIPRDLWVPLSTGGSAKIDAAYSYGGAAAAIATVQRNFHVHIDEYAWIGLKGLIKLIDQLGGVDLFVTNPVLDDFYPNDIDVTYFYGYTRVAVLPGPQHLDGTHALQYVRSRHNDINGDFGRSARQQEVLLALKAKASTLNAADLPDIVNALKGEFKTSMGLDRVRSLLGVANAFDPANVRQIVLYVPAYTSYGQISGQSVLIPHWSEILAVTRSVFP
ncbi:MAG TPA: LCP family protein [Candidatus Dormibacteraeota bacterium]|nr:LCP family protein [Candidatus Dormibacteraeota bacterium]